MTPEICEARRGNRFWCVAQLLCLRERLKLFQRLILDLPDPLARDVERATYLVECPWTVKRDRIATRTRVRLGAITRPPLSVEPARILARAPFEAVGAVSCSPRLEAVGTTDAGGARRLGRLTKTEGRQEDSPEKESQPGGLSPCLGPSWLAVKAPGELRALALARATERVAGRDPAVVGGER